MNLNTLNLNQPQIEITGGGEIGFARASAPFAKLTVNRYCLTINVGIVGKVLFRPSDIISIESYSGFKSGIRIVHNVASYKNKVVFIYGGRAADLIAQIEQIGFLNNLDPLLPADVEAEIAQAQTSGSFGFKLGFVVGFVVLWNVLLLPGVLNVVASKSINTFSLSTRAATGLMCLVTLLILFIPAVQQRVLKPGFTIKDVRGSLYFVLLIGAILFLVTTFMPMPR